MSDPPKHEASPGQPAADVANFGLIRPPFVYAGSIGLLIHWLWPVRLLPASVGVPVGVLVVLVAVALFVSAVRTFRKASTPVPGNRPTTPPSFARVHTVSAETPSISLSRSFSSDSPRGSTASACCSRFFRPWPSWRWW
jgi:hypothetical protein